jgi:hypothetical protein
MNGALVGAGVHKPEVLSLHPFMCFFSYIRLGEEGKKEKGKNRRCALHCMATFFFLFFSKFVTIVIFI